MLFGIIFLSAGVFLISLATVNILSNLHIKREGVRVKAIAVDIHRTSKVGKNTRCTLYHPIFEYPVDGRAVKTQGHGTACCNGKRKQHHCF